MMQTTTKTTGAGATSTGADRRASRREPVFTIGRLTCMDVDGVCSQEVMVTDVSLHGCGFRCPVMLDGKSTYQIEIGAGPLRLSANLNIVRARQRPDGTYDLGARFC